MAREDAAEIGLLQAVERHGLEADGARIAAESAAEACRDARIALAGCEEALVLHPVTPAPSPASRLVPVSVVAGTAAAAPSTAAAAAGVASASGIAPDEAGLGSEAPPAGGPEPAAPPGVAAGAEIPATGPLVGADGGLIDEDAAERAESPQAAILAVLAGNRAVMHRIATSLADGDPGEEAHWQLQLAALADAVMERAIDGAALLFPEEHPFWGPYTQLQCREIAAALAALGYRFDGLGGFADDRLPGQRELSLAIGYAGLDPMRIRIWPTEAQMPHLFEDVQVDAGGFLAGAAGDLSLGEMIDLLGRRAESLSDLWNAWGRVRPLLLEPA